MAVGRGDRGEQVKTLQRVLNAWYPNVDLVEDGVYGAKTEAAVRGLQERAQLPVTGVADDATLQKLGIKSTAASSSVWPPKGAAWSASWDSSNPRDGGKFKNAPWNWASATPVVRSGRLRVELPSDGRQAPAPGQDAEDGSRRCELEPALPDTVTPRSGRTVWHRWDLTLVNFPTDTSAWNVIAQWKQDGTGSPPVELSVVRGRWVLILHNAGGSVVAKHDIGPAEQGRSVRLIIGITYGTSGRLVAYHDGTKTRDVAAPTMHAGKSSYLKTGLYADDALSGPLCIEFDRMAVGPSYATVTS